jgi:uncharacterized protein YecA (UPF0149 family)
MAPAPELPNFSPDSSLTDDQHHVLALLADGQSLTSAAEIAGIHRNTIRNTIRNWRRASPAFACEAEFAVREQALAWHDRSLALAPQAFQLLEHVLHNADTNAALRVRAALAILKIAAERLRVHNEIENHAQPCTIRRSPDPGRNSSCPCGSGQKWKRCCATAPQTASAAA